MRGDLAVQTIDLFCGCGGLTAGFRAAGFENLVGFDNWQAALDTYSANNPDQGEMLDLGDLSASLERLAEYKGIDGVIGGTSLPGIFRLRASVLRVIVPI